MVRRVAGWVAAVLMLCALQGRCGAQEAPLVSVGSAVPPSSPRPVAPLSAADQLDWPYAPPSGWFVGVKAPSNAT